MELTIYLNIISDSRIQSIISKGPSYRFPCHIDFNKSYDILLFPCHIDFNSSYVVSLRKHAYSNILKILPPKNENFQIKIPIFYIILIKHRLWTHNLCF